jgi:hypothetical protein
MSGLGEVFWMMRVDSRNLLAFHLFGGLSRARSLR